MIVEFKTAKLAKEHGFTQSENPSYLLCDYTECNVLHENPNNLNIGDLIGFYVPEKTINAPTQSNLLKHIREEHNIDITVYPVEMKTETRTIHQEIQDKEYAYYISIGGVQQFHTIKIFTTYELAMEAGLVEVLQNQIN